WGGGGGGSVGSAAQPHPQPPCSLLPQQERLGPGTYNIRDFLQETRPCSLRGICDTREPRFRDGRRDCFPGPGTYGPQGNPYIPLKERDKRHASTRGVMESRTVRSQPPVPFPPCLQGSGLGPGTYHLRSSIDEGLRRVVDSRPCQTFSGHKSKPALSLLLRSLIQQRKGTKPSTGAVKGFLEELMLRENKKKGCFSTLPRNPGCPTERIFWATLSQCPREAWAVGPGSYNPKPIERSAYSNQPPFWSSAKRFDRKSYRLFTGNENPVGVGRYDITEHEKYPPKTRYQSLYQCDTRRYLSDLKRDTYLLERIKPVGKNNRSDLISAPRCPGT
ncbi:LEXM protein, partial [Rostratula benghalensis]|nr:LEXM protein [Rostratula benghalensis]